MQDIQVLSGANLITAAMVLAAIAGLVILAASAVDAIRKLRKPRETRESGLAEWREQCDDKLERDYRTITEHGKRLDRVEEGQQVICTGVHALLEHALHNGNSDEMGKASTALFEHLNRR